MQSRIFAYGSAMSEIPPGARIIGVARLDGYALGFRRRSIRWGGGAADILPRAGASVWGALYELPDKGVEELDAREGEGFAYRRVGVDVELDGRRVSAETYEVIDKEPEDVPPTPAYAAALLAGARQRGLPEDYIAELERRTAAD